MKLSPPRLLRMPNGGDAIASDDLRQKKLNTFFYAVFLGTLAALVVMILYFIYAMASMYNGSRAFDWLLSVFWDFVVVMDFSLSDAPYLVEGSSYPPIAMLMLYPFALICKSVYIKYDAAVMTPEAMNTGVITTPQFWVALVLFFVICTTLIILLLSKLFNIKGFNLVKLTAVIMLSAPFVYAIMRGNVIYLALIFTLVFLVFKDSKNAVLRELSYVSLALAGAIKIYPLFFGVFLLKDKKFFASLRVAVYFFLLFFLPFLLITGESEPFTNFLANMGGFAGDRERLVGSNNLSLTADLLKFSGLFLHLEGGAAPVIRTVSLALTVIMFGISVVGALITKSNFSRYVICFAIVALVPTVSYYYIVVFAILPFIEFVRSCETLCKSHRLLYTLGFLFLFTTVLVVSYSFGAHSCVILGMLFLELWRIFWRELPKRKQQKQLMMA